MNTLNYFLTLDTRRQPARQRAARRRTSSAAAPTPTSRSSSPRQRDKMLAALVGLDADIIGLNELENTTGVDPLGDSTASWPGSTRSLGAGTYAYIEPGSIGTDAIRVGLIYKPATVTPVGAFEILDSTDDPRFIDTRTGRRWRRRSTSTRPARRFTVVVNHLKSKGSDCLRRRRPGHRRRPGQLQPDAHAAAEALVDWLATDPTGSGDADVLIIGDLNSYAKEDPIDAIRAGADDTAGTADDYTNLIAAVQGTYAYSYVFDGQAGYLDHALASAGLTAR